MLRIRYYKTEEWQLIDMDIKMIVMDLDGTLLRTDKSISDYTAEVLNRCRERGIKVVIATARYVKQVKNFSKKISLDAIIALNGAVIYVDDDIVAEYRIPENTKQQILRELHAAGIKMAAEAANVVYTNRHAPGDEKIAWDFASDVPVAIHRISIRHDDPKLIKSITAKYHDLRLYPNSGDNLFDIDSVEAGKSKGITILSERFGIPLSDIVAFGDDFNDIEMLKNCGIGVAVANACEEAKSAADHVCDSNDEDGIAKWLDNIVLC
jgi:Cof subfamily protein (haloacid dehalogenase superfamily)